MFVVVDLDGTISLTEHREGLIKKNIEHDSPEDQWKAFFEACDGDAPNVPMIEILNLLISAPHIRLEIWTGRCESVRAKTVKWLTKHVKKINPDSTIPLLMRPEGDRSADIELKKRFMHKRGTPDLIFDDRNKTVKEWRKMGISCFQVQESTY